MKYLPVIFTAAYIVDEYSHKIEESNLLVSVNNVLCADNPEPQATYNSIAVIEALFIRGKHIKLAYISCNSQLTIFLAFKMSVTDGFSKLLTFWLQIIFGNCQVGGEIANFVLKFTTKFQSSI